MGRKFIPLERRRVRVDASLDPDVARALRGWCEEAGVTVSLAVESAVVRFLSSEGVKFGRPVTL